MVGREAACHKPVADCHGLNAAAMREALLRCDAIAQLPEIREYIIVKEMRNLIKGALTAPPRNCDRFATLDDARNAFFADYVPDETCSSANAFAIWLFDEAKGETDGSK